ncbi:MAG: type II secretion system F family protein [Actinomycetota bacterium]|nr:type II secretion system F family protein [Actinomycetota bacterium]
MTAWLPALLAAVGVAVALGLPMPRRHLGQARLGPRRLAPPALALGGVTAALLVIPVGPVGAAVSGVLVVIGKRALDGRARDKARQHERDSAGEAMAVLASELRAGRPPGVALGSAAAVASGPTALALREASGATRMGTGAPELLARRASESAVPELLNGLSVCLQVCQGAGSSLAVAVDRLEEALRADQACRDEVEAELAGPRATATTLAVLPAFGLLMGAGMGARPLHVLLHTTVGAGCLAVGVALDVAGWCWTNAIVRRAQEPS